MNFKTLAKYALTVALCAIVSATSLAWDIGTTYWGVCFTNAPALPTGIGITRTPGSFSFEDNMYSRRLILPAYYAWLDGYDTRAAVDANSMPRNRPHAYRRLAYYSNTTNEVGSFLSRKENIRQGKIAPWWSSSNGTLWSSVFSDYESYTLEGKTYNDFDWTQNPIQLIYDDDDNPPSSLHTQFCFNYSQLWPSTYYPLQTNNADRAENSFQRMLYYCDFGKEPGYGERSEIRNYFNNRYLSRSDKYHTTFDEIIHTSFGPGYYAEPITNRTHRLTIDTLAAADEALSLYTRSYKESEPTRHITKKVTGHARIIYIGYADLSVDMKFNFHTGECSGTAGLSSSPTVTLVTNYIERVEKDNTMNAPMACFARVDKPSKIFYAHAHPYLYYGTADVSLDELSDILDPIYAGEPVKIDITGLVVSWLGYMGVMVSAKRSDSGSWLQHPYAIPFEGGGHVTEGNLDLNLQAYYHYVTALNPSHAATRPVYPTILNEYIDNERWYFFSSFCCTTNYSNATELDELRDRIYALKDVPTDWGYRCRRQESEGSYSPYWFPQFYNEELTMLKEKCLAFTGESFFVDAMLYTGMTPAVATAYMSGPYEFTPEITYQGCTLTNAVLRKVDGHYVIGESGNVISAGTAMSHIAVKRTGKDPTSFPPGRAIDTYMGDVTEVNWLFPQLKEQ